MEPFGTDRAMAVPGSGLAVGLPWLVPSRAQAAATSQMAARKKAQVFPRVITAPSRAVYPWLRHLLFKLTTHVEADEFPLAVTGPEGARRYTFRAARVAERDYAAVLKTAGPFGAMWVRIPPRARGALSISGASIGD